MELSAWLIRAGAAGVMVAFAFHQLALPRRWLASYEQGWVRALLPFAAETKLRLHALGNLGLGFWLVSGIAPLFSAWIALFWWLTILPFSFRGNWEVGMRDLAIVLALAALVSLTSLL